MKKTDPAAEKPGTDAYFTVEAALVIPVVISIIVMVMYLSFYLYDRCVLSQDCYVLCYRQSIEKGKADRAGREAARAQFGEKLFMLSRFETSSSNGQAIHVRGNAAMTPPLFGLPLFDAEENWTLGVEEKAKKTDPPGDTRRVRRILNLAAEAAGAAQMQ